MWVCISQNSSNSLEGRDVVDITDFSREDLESLFNHTEKIKENPLRFSKSLEGKFVALLFFEPSTRTHGSFFTATHRLGGIVYDIREPKASSAAKGESLFDTIKMFEGWEYDCIVIRHDLEGTAKYFADKTLIPVINGGDGTNQHPTQAMLDLFTIREAKGKIDGLNIGIMGDLKHGRTVPSLSFALSNYKVRLSYIAPDILQVKNSVVRFLDSRNVSYEKVDNVEKVIGKLDILYVTRVQKERFEEPVEYEKVKGSYVVNKKLLEKAKPDLKVMHPLPRVEELSYEVDETPHALYFQQAKNGLYLRMGLLHDIIADKSQFERNF